MNVDKKTFHIEKLYAGFIVTYSDGNKFAFSSNKQLEEFIMSHLNYMFKFHCSDFTTGFISLEFEEKPTKSI